MSSKILSVLALLVGFFLLAAPDARAQQKINLNLGGFTVRSEDARVAGDELVADLSDTEPLYFQIKDFNGFTFGGEYLVGIGNWLDVGAGVNYYQRTVPSVYANLVNDNGNEIAQDLKLRIIPITATVRFLPLGQEGVVQPYIGAGVGVFPYRYSETGEFVDTTDNSIFRGNYVSSGTAVGPVVVGGIVIPFGATFGLGFDVRWQSANASLGSDFTAFRTNPKIDLGGVSYQAVVQIRFGRR
jgi:hypothetical protein